MAKVINPFGDMEIGTPKNDIERYMNAAQKLEFALEKLTDAKLRWKPNPKKWSIREIVCHLAESEVIGVGRMNLIIASGSTPPILYGYDQDILAERNQYNIQDELLAVSLFKSLRKYHTSVLKSLPQEIFDKHGIHQEKGKMTLSDLVTHYATHAEIHLKQIEYLKEQLSHDPR